jgi:hypothetical protein
MEQQQTFHALPPPPKGWAFADTYVDSNLKKWCLPRLPIEESAARHVDAGRGA